MQKAYSIYKRTKRRWQHIWCIPQQLYSIHSANNIHIIQAKFVFERDFLFFFFSLIASKIKYCPHSSAINCRWIGIHQNLPQLIVSSDNYMKAHTICLWEREYIICRVKWMTSFVTYSAGQESKTFVINGYFQAI